MAKDPKDAGPDDDWQYEATRPPDTATQPTPALSGLPEWGDSVLEAVERGHTGSLSVPGGGAKAPPLPTKAARAVAPLPPEAPARAGAVPPPPPKPPARSAAPPPPPPPPKPGARAVAALSSESDVPAGGPLPPGAAGAPEGSEEEQAQAEEFFRVAAQNVWGAREETPSAPDIDFASGLLSLDSVNFDLSGTFELDSRPPLAGAFSLDADNHANAGALLGTAPDRDDLSNVLAALQDDPDFGREPNDAPVPPKPSREPSALAGAAPRRPSTGGLPPLIDYDPALDPSEQFGASFDPKGAAATAGGKADDATVLELDDALVTSGRYAARAGRSSEAVRVVQVKRPTRKD